MPAHGNTLARVGGNCCSQPRRLSPHTIEIVIWANGRKINEIIQTFVLLRLHASQGSLFLVFGVLVNVVPMPSGIDRIVEKWLSLVRVANGRGLLGTRVK